MAEDNKSLQQMGYELDVTLYTLGDIMDLTDDALPMRDRMAALIKGITKGDARKIRLVDLPQFMDAITNALNVKSNPS